MRNTLIVAGIGPGCYEQMTVQVIHALESCDCIVGYEAYLAMLREHFPEKKYLSSPMRQEEERCQMALRLAAAGEKLVFVCGGDAGVYGLAGLLHEMAAAYPELAVKVLPGVTAAVGGAALLGAPLVHDFVCISLSDALTPWESIAMRLRHAAYGDFCIVLYNPGSHHRPEHLKRAVSILLDTLPPDRPCGLVEQIGRKGESWQLCTLAELQTKEATMCSTVFIGNASTAVVRGRLVTPRGYRFEREGTQ